MKPNVLFIDAVIPGVVVNTLFHSF